MADTCLFIHVPKTGGRSFDALLTDFFPPAITCPSYFEDQCVSPTVEFGRYRFFRGHHSYFLITALPADTKVFTLLRNPVARAMSAYEHILHDSSHYHHQLLKEQGSSLAEFARHPTLSQHIANTQTRMLGRSLDFSHLRRTAAFRPEFTPRGEVFLRVLRSFDATREELMVAKKRLATMAFFGLTECFDESCRRFARMMGRPVSCVPKLNVTPAAVSARRSGYSDADIAAVTEINALDVELFAYARDLFDTGQASSAGVAGQP